MTSLWKKLFFVYFTVNIIIQEKGAFLYYFEITLNEIFAHISKYINISKKRTIFFGSFLKIVNINISRNRMLLLLWKSRFLSISPSISTFQGLERVFGNNLKKLFSLHIYENINISRQIRLSLWKSLFMKYWLFEEKDVVLTSLWKNGFFVPLFFPFCK